MVDYDNIVEKCEDCRYFEEMWDSFEGCGGRAVPQKIDEVCHHPLNKNKGELREEEGTVAESCPLKERAKHEHTP